MKKLIFIFSIFIFLVSCTNEKRNDFITSRIENAETKYPYSIYEITYNEHEYIIFEGDHGCTGETIGGRGSGCCSGVVHSPDCKKCKEI